MDSNEHNRMREYYWRKGIPSLVLAFVTLFLAGYSYWFVQPNIQNRYQSIVESNLRELGLVEAPADSLPGATSRERADDTEAARNLRLEKLGETHLCLRRQIIWSNQDDLPRYRTGLVSAALSDWFLDEARRLSTETPSNAGLAVKIRDSVSRARAESQKGMEAMRAAIKINGPLANRALLWIVRNQLSEKPELSPSDFTDLEKTVREILRNQESTDDKSQLQDRLETNALLAQLLLRSSLSPLSQSEVESRMERLRESMKLIPEESMRNVLNARWIAGARLALDPKNAKQIAWQGTQSFWESRGEFSLPIDTIAAAFECMLIGGSLKEAQTFLSEQLPSVPAFEQPELRMRTSNACIRMLVATSIHQLSESNTISNQVPAVLLIAIQLQPESAELLSLIESIAVSPIQDDLFVNLARFIEGGSDSGLKALLGIVRFSTDNSISQGIDSTSGSIQLDFESVVKTQPIMGIVASKLAIRQTSQNRDLASRWTAVLKGVTKASPETLVVWSDLANLYMVQSQYEQAILCLEYLDAKLPENEDIKDGLERAKESLKATGQF